MSRRARVARRYAAHMAQVEPMIERLAIRMSDGDLDLLDDLRQEGRIGALLFEPSEDHGILGFQLQLRAAVAHRIFHFAGRERERKAGAVRLELMRDDREEGRDA